MSQQQSVHTTTWPQRHRETFGELAVWLKALKLESPTVLEVGPGAATRLLSRHIRAGEGQDLSWWANRLRAGLRNLDGLLRRLPWTALYSYEPMELRDVLPSGSKLIVADISTRVIEAIRKQSPDVEARVFDFSARAFDRPVDVVVCLCVLVRAAEGNKMFSNLYHSLKPGGLFVIDNRSRSNFGTGDLPLERLSSQVWRKPGP